MHKTFNDVTRTKNKNVPQIKKKYQKCNKSTLILKNLQNYQKFKKKYQKPQKIL